jgi:hypothetical protein
MAQQVSRRQANPRRWSRKTWILAGVAAALIIFRGFLPSIVTGHVNKILGSIPGYRGHIDDVDISLIRGAYVIQNPRLDKLNGDIPVPFFSAREIDLSIEWSALFNGSLVGEVEFVQPAVNFVQGKDENDSQDGGGADFTEKVKDLFPLKINRFDITDGEVHFRNFQTSPKVDIYLDSLFVRATNLTNNRKVAKTLVASIDARANAMESGRLKAHLDIDPYSPQPTFNIDCQLERLRLTQLNEFFRAYAAVDVESGTFDMYSELAAERGRFRGYVKPLFKDMRVLDIKEDSDNPLEVIWESLVEAVTNLLTNEPREQVGTTIPFTGRVDDPDADILATLGGLLKNAFIRALAPGIEGTIKLRTAKEAQ